MLNSLSICIRQLQRGCTALQWVREVPKTATLTFKRHQYTKSDFDQYGSAYTEKDDRHRSEYGRYGSPYRKKNYTYNRNRNSYGGSYNDTHRQRYDNTDYDRKSWLSEGLAEDSGKAELNKPLEFEKGGFKLSDSVLNCSKEEVDAFRKENDLEIRLGNDRVPNPIRSFDEANFNEHTMKRIAEQGWEKPTPVQSQSWSIALSDLNLIALSPTGSGKTLAYVLPAFEHIRRRGQECFEHSGASRNFKPTALFIAPTRELARQIASVVKLFSPPFIRHICVYGGVPDTWVYGCCNTGVQICIATPGRLCKNLIEGVLNLSACTYIVVDEFDRVLSPQFEDELRLIFKKCPSHKQVLAFSATPLEDLEEVTQTLIPNPVLLAAEDSNTMKQNIKQNFIRCSEDEQIPRLKNLINEIRESDPEGKIILFVNRCKEVDFYARMLRSYRPLGLHGMLSQSRRETTLKDFRTRDGSILIATDVAGRGLDIAGVNHIILTDIPDDVEQYIHRIGRCGRQDAIGTSYTFITNNIKPSKVVDLIQLLMEKNYNVEPELIEFCNKFRRDKHVTRVLRKFNQY